MRRIIRIVNYKKVSKYKTLTSPYNLTTIKLKHVKVVSNPPKNGYVHMFIYKTNIRGIS
jgi:hypothetical protein